MSAAVSFLPFDAAAAIAFRPASLVCATPSLVRNSASIVARISVFSFRNCRDCSRPWPMRSPRKLNQDPLFSTTPLRCAQIQQVVFARNALAIDHVDLGFAERRRHLVLDHLHLGAVADHGVAILDRSLAATSSRTEA